MLNKLGLFFSLSIAIFSFSAFAQEQDLAEPDAATVESVGEEIKAPILVELFSSQSCLFCPEADELLIDLIAKDDIIAFSCHVDYFDIQPNALSLRVCTERQNAYVKSLAAGTNYTPQIVVNGQEERVGYEVEDVKSAIAAARDIAGVVSLKIERNEESGDFSFMLPELDFDGQKHPVYMVVYQKPVDWKIKQGLHKGKTRRYEHLARTVEKMSDWGGEETKTVFAADVQETDAGIIIFVQEEKSGKIWAAGEYKLAKQVPTKDVVLDAVPAVQEKSELVEEVIQDGQEPDKNEVLPHVDAEEKISPAHSAEE